jgi:hypothetical protein
MAVCHRQIGVKTPATADQRFGLKYKAIASNFRAPDRSFLCGATYFQ